MAKLYEYAVLLDEQRDKHGEIIDEAEVIVPVTVVAARDDSQAELLAARSIPDEYIGRGVIDRLQVVVRPF